VISILPAARLSSDRAMKVKSRDSAAPERSYFSVERAAHRHPLRTEEKSEAPKTTSIDLVLVPHQINSNPGYQIL
jgi:hypothetical protein